MKNKYGCIKSILDGSEQVFKAQGSMEIPNEYSYKNYLPKVLNQGNEPICVPCSISSYINWDLNIRNNEDEKDYHINVNEIYDSRSNNDEDNGMMIKEALSYLLDKVISADRESLNSLMGSKSTQSLVYHQTRHELFRWFSTELMQLIKLIPTEQITYYILKETDNIEDILKGVSNELHS